MSCKPLKAKQTDCCASCACPVFTLTSYFDARNVRSLIYFPPEILSTSTHFQKTAINQVKHFNEHRLHITIRRLSLMLILSENKI